jgi:UDP-GlcNAc:undecaprenyl-phosphate GlcNAc-1-phosphate transferase
MRLILIACLTAGLSYSLVPLASWLAKRFGALDNPAIDPARRHHQQSIPLAGGLAIATTILIVGSIFTFFVPILDGPFLNLGQLLALAAGLIIIVLGGFLDDKYKLPPHLSIIAPAVAALIVIGSGVGVNFVTNPFGGVIRLDAWKVELFSWQGQAFVLAVVAEAFAFLWLMTMMYTTKILDGLDGLVTGLTVIAATIVVGLCLRPPVLQPDTALLATIVAAAFLGFLPWNWSPAKVFLGEGGSILAGFTLGFISIAAGGKIATTLLVMGIPALDLFVVALRRLLVERKSFAESDMSHLHFRLLQAGLSTRQVVLVLYAIGLAFGLVALTQQTIVKTLALLALACCLAVGLFLTRTTKNN